MDKQEQKVLIQELKQKVEQQENTIVQLLEIVAATNRRVTDLSRKYLSL